ncbi:MAG: hypothetical protein NT013_19625 [Planctomycetia bacterium]|nr:hypothetical protein [Planctomycetia bacterium]
MHLCRQGHPENSPAIYRWVVVVNMPSKPRQRRKMIEHELDADPSFVPGGILPRSTSHSF